jgi:hypothetical protein
MGLVFRQFKPWRRPTTPPLEAVLAAVLAHRPKRRSLINQRPLPRLRELFAEFSAEKHSSHPRNRRSGAVPAWPVARCVRVYQQLVPAGGVMGADNARRGRGMPPVNPAGHGGNQKSRREAGMAMSRSRPVIFASGLLQQAAGVITDFSAGNAVLGCCRRPAVRRGSLACRAGKEEDMATRAPMRSEQSQS